MRIIDQRVSAAPEGDFVVFLVGMRFRWRQVNRWWPHFQAMSRMVSELNHDPESGYLGGESWIGNPTIMVQYWRSFEHLRSYAHNPDRHHKQAWAAFNAALADGADLGVWHEAYQVRAGDYFTRYNRMPPFGLVRATRTIRTAGGSDLRANRGLLRGVVPGASKSGDVSCEYGFDDG